VRQGVIATAALVALAVSAAPAALGADAREPEQWAFNPSAVIDVPAAWQLASGTGVTVAVVDTGVKLDHPDLAPNIWTNPREIPGNGIDDDGNGYVDDVHGIDLVSPDPAENDPSDDNGHGTHVAGIIAAALNGQGVVGVAFHAKIMAVKVLGPDGSGTLNAVAEGIRYAAANGARIINTSLASPSDSPALDAAIAFAASANALVISSAGNEGRDLDVTPSYPASVPAQNLIGVAATAPDDGKALAHISNFGRLTIPIAAPGQEILSTAMNGGYELRTGTSMAAPHVAGVAALMASANPSLSASDLRAKIVGSSVGAAGAPVGSGFVDAAAAVRSVISASRLTIAQHPTLALLSATRSVRGGKATLVVQATVSGAPDAIARFAMSSGGTSLGVLPRTGATFTMRKTLPAARLTGALRIRALDRTGRQLASVSGRIKLVPASKQNIGGDRNTGTTGPLAYAVA
jgi:subtilisin family serine protease